MANSYEDNREWGSSTKRVINGVPIIDEIHMLTPVEKYSRRCFYGHEFPGAENGDDFRVGEDNIAFEFSHLFGDCEADEDFYWDDKLIEMLERLRIPFHGTTRYCWGKWNEFDVSEPKRLKDLGMMLNHAALVMDACLDVMTPAVERLKAARPAHAKKARLSQKEYVLSTDELVDYLPEHDIDTLSSTLGYISSYVPLWPHPDETNAQWAEQLEKADRSLYHDLKAFKAYVDEHGGDEGMIAELEAELAKGTFSSLTKEA